MRTLGLIRTATPPPARDLWLRLRARLGDDDRVHLRLPALGWREATAIAAALGTLAVVPDPVRFLIACGLL
ncbi:MAG TPA: hypothetical protein VJO72_09980 [Candidatus Dormibacteraeota bacterium]|nr:hypothetical protein [Candidatus Dormibacteraeota bacterium]